MPNLDPNITKHMLRVIGVESIEALFQDIPKDIMYTKELRIPEARSELEVERHLEELLSKNKTYPEQLCFLGGGVWHHHVPAAVDAIASRSEFYTSYTPYQAEISQGLLQALFEYQSLICDLTGMDVANSSMYDWATSLGEAARMAYRVTKRKKIIVSRNVGPERINVLKTYCNPLNMLVQVVDFNHMTGEADINRLSKAIDDEVAATYLENPNFFGVLEQNAAEVGELVHRCGSLYIVGVEPTSLGILRPPGEYGADVVVGEGQPLGLHMNFGGPLLGIYAIKESDLLLRQMPGRIVGLTTTKDGRERGFTMVLQTREQHIRRERATSNICTNQALCAIRVAAYLSLLGAEGLRSLSETVLANSHYAARILSQIKGVKSPLFTASFFKDFAVGLEKLTMSTEDLFLILAENGVEAALPLGRYFEDFKDAVLFSVTEVHTIRDIQRLAEVLEKVLGVA